VPYNGSGVFSILNTFVPNTTILSSAVNANFTDIASGLSDVLTRDGQAGMTAALAMGNHNITGMADPVNAQDAATKNYTDTLFATAWSTGDVKLTLKTTADSGWVLFTDGTIGDASSGATVASAATSALFTLLYNNISDTYAPLFTSTGAATTRAAQGTAAAAYAAHCRVSTTKTLGRALAIAGSGSGLTARTLGQTLGAETYQIQTTNLPAYTPSGSVSSTTTLSAGAAGAAVWSSGAGVLAISAGTQYSVGPAITASTSSTFTGTPQGGSQVAFSIMNPTSYLNAMVKL
jgi:hypothetical protein